MSESRIRLHVVPMTFRAACAWVDVYHRHNKPPRGCKFCIGAAGPDGEVHGVAMIGRPVARYWDDGFTVEVNRTCTDGTRNANSFLYGASWRCAREMGYLRMITYTQHAEPGTSLTAAGWRVVAERAARPGWFDSTADGRMRELRDEVGCGGVPHTVWEVVA